MTDVRSLHREAMEIAERAMEALHEDRWDEARSLFRQASQIESRAAMEYADSADTEPTRSVLWRSAATLALNGELPGYAAYLAARGLEGNPPAETREELRELLNSIRPESLSDTGYALGSTADRDRWERSVSAFSALASTLDDMRRMLAETNLVAGELSYSLVRRILQTAHDTFQQYAPNADLSLDLFGLTRDRTQTWVSVPQRSDTVLEDWPVAAKALIQEQEEAVLRGHRFAASTRDLADHGVLSADTAQLLRTVGVQGAVVWPVCDYDDTRNLVPALAFLAMTSDPAIFANDTAKRLIPQTVSLLELTLAIGRRDERLMKGPDPELDAPQMH
jgi:hypothetical protein